MAGICDIDGNPGYHCNDMGHGCWRKVPLCKDSECVCHVTHIYLGEKQHVNNLMLEMANEGIFGLDYVVHNRAAGK